MPSESEHPAHEVALLWLAATLCDADTEPVDDADELDELAD